MARRIAPRPTTTTEAPEAAGFPPRVLCWYQRIADGRGGQAPHRPYDPWASTAHGGPKP